MLIRRASVSVCCRSTLAFLASGLMWATLVAAAQEMGSQEAAISAVPKSVAVAGGAIDVPMTLEFGSPVVSVSINGRGPFRFVLDTGAAVTVLNRDLAVELNLPHAGTMRVGDPADPQAILADIVSIDHLAIGGVELSTVQALSWDQSSLYRSPDGPRGVLGMPLFADLLVTIDYPRHRVRVSTAMLPPPNGADIFSYDLSPGGTFEVMATVAGASMKAGIDSGSGGGITFPKSAIDQLPLVAPPVAVGRGRTVGGEAVILGATLNGAFALGRYQVDHPEVAFNERLRGANLGSRFLARFALSIDQRNHRLQLAESAPAEERSSSAPSVSDDYAGTYGERRITAEGGAHYLQRMTGPLGEGPRLKMTPISADEFGLEGLPEARVKFVRDAAGRVVELDVLGPSGTWEKAQRGGIEGHRPPQEGR